MISRKNVVCLISFSSSFTAFVFTEKLLPFYIFSHFYYSVDRQKKCISRRRHVCGYAWMQMSSSIEKKNLDMGMMVYGKNVVSYPYFFLRRMTHFHFSTKQAINNTMSCKMRSQPLKVQIRKVKDGFGKIKIAQRGARTHDPEIKSLMLYRLS